MKNFFSKIPLKTFKIVSVIICGIGDVIIIAYLWGLFSDFSNFEKMLRLGFPDLRQQYDEEFKRELFQVNLNSLKIMLALYIVFHLIHYVCYLLNKKFALIYLKIMVWVAGPGLILVGLNSMGDGNIIHHLLIPQGILFLFVGMGMINMPSMARQS